MVIIPCNSPLWSPPMESVSQTFTVSANSTYLQNIYVDGILATSPVTVQNTISSMDINLLTSSGMSFNLYIETMARPISEQSIGISVDENRTVEQVSFGFDFIQNGTPSEDSIVVDGGYSGTINIPGHITHIGIQVD